MGNAVSDDARLLRAILESPRDILVYALDREYRYLAFNENHRRVMSDIHDVDVAVGRCMLDLVTRAEDRDRVRRNLDRALAGEHFTVPEAYGAAARGRRHYQGTYAPLRDADGAVTGLTVFATDLTHAQSHLLHAQKLESIGVMAAGVAHDFSNLLTGIVGAAELALTESPEGAPGRERVQRIERSATQAAALIRQMLAYAGHASVERGAVDLTGLVRETEALLRATATRNVELDLELAEALPPVSAERTQLQQVLVNLVLNAAEAIGQGRAGRVTVTTSVRELGPEDLARAPVDDGLPAGSYVRLAVSDDGPGIDGADLSHLFDPFFTTKVAGRGLGLGLASVLGIVRSHGGTVLVDSVPGAGATFEVFLPIASDPKPSSPPVLPAQDHGLVLIVDDEEPVRELAAEVVGRMGYAVLQAADGVEGVELLAAHRDQVRVVLLDMTMPRLDGEAAFRRVRAIRPDVPVVVVSGWTQEHARLRFLAGEARVAFLPKPFRLAQIKDAIRGALGEE